MRNSNLDIQIWNSKSEYVDRVLKLLPKANIDASHTKYIVLLNEGEVIGTISFNHYNESVLMFTPQEFKLSFNTKISAGSFIQVIDFVLDGKYYDLGLEYLMFEKLVDYIGENKLEYCSCQAFEQILFMLRHSPYRMDPLLLADGTSYLVFKYEDIKVALKYIKLQAIAAKVNFVLYAKDNLPDFSGNVTKHTAEGLWL